MEEKKCAKCGEIKPVTAFSAHKNSPDGLQYACKECQREYWKNRYHEQKVQPLPLNDKMEALSNYTPRQLMTELSRRGYSGTLKYVQEIKLDALR
jgi:hypothetical protein